MKNRVKLAQSVVHTVSHRGQVTHALTILNQDQLRRMTARIRDPDEFLSDYGVRSLSRAAPEAHPSEFDGSQVRYGAGRVA